MWEVLLPRAPCVQLANRRHAQLPPAAGRADGHAAAAPRLEPEHDLAAAIRLRALRDTRATDPHDRLAQPLPVLRHGHAHTLGLPLAHAEVPRTRLGRARLAA